MSLSGHFLILLAIYFYLASLKTQKEYLYHYCALVITSVFIHAYLAIMVIFIFIAHSVRLVFKNIRLLERVVIFWFFLAFILLISNLTILGYSSYRSSGVWGTWAWNIISPFYPNRWTMIFSFLPSEQGNLETTTYIGIGMLIITLFFVMPTFNKFKGSYDYLKRDYLPIGIACIIMTLIAITNKISFGIWQLEVAAPEILTEYFQVFRASGRFVWPLLYIALLASLISFYKYINRYKPVLLFCLLLAIQIVDTRPGWSDLFTNNELENHKFSLDKISEKWYNFGTHYTEIVVSRSSDNQDFVPSCWPRVAIIAKELGLATNCVYLARSNFGEELLQNRKILYQITSGNLDHNRIYVIPNDLKYSEKLKKRIQRKEIITSQIETFTVLRYSADYIHAQSSRT
jgi:hypothetical protein